MPPTPSPPGCAGVRARDAPAGPILPARAGVPRRSSLIDARYRPPPGTGLHPAAAGAPGFYDYRLSDSSAIRLPGQAEPVRVFEVQVRPRDPARPALIGSIFVDRRRGDIVRMAFTFTAASYVCPPPCLRYRLCPTFFPGLSKAPLEP